MFKVLGLWGSPGFGHLLCMWLGLNPAPRRVLGALPAVTPELSWKWSQASKTKETMSICTFYQMINHDTHDKFHSAILIINLAVYTNI